MRKRAYRPEVAGCLENRSLLSGGRRIVGPSNRSHACQFNLVPERIQKAFHLFREGIGFSPLHDDIFNAIAIIPFAHVDGLGTSINGIVSRLQQYAG